MFSTTYLQGLGYVGVYADFATWVYGESCINVLILYIALITDA